MKQLPHALLPSKTFLFGEYSVLKDGPAVILATPPFFEITNHWPKQSIANAMQRNRFTIVDNNNYKGLGRSSAECIASWLETSEAPDLEQLLSSYQQAVRSQGLIASGADVMCQWLGRCTSFSDKTSVAWPFPEIDLGVWLTGNKVATQNHLKKTKLKFNSIRQQANYCDQAWQNRDFNSLVAAIKDFQAELVRLDLQAQDTLAQVQQITNNSPAILAKGCGALGADVILTLSAVNVRETMKQKINLTNVFIGNYVVDGLSQQWQHCQHSIRNANGNKDI